MPLVPGSEGRLAGVDEARRVAADVGYPVLLKAASGGGGRGMRPVADPSELEAAYATATAEAQAAFGDGGLYLEKIVVDAHHVEVQVLGDGARRRARRSASASAACSGATRSCSRSRPRRSSSAEARAQLYDAALGAVRATRYRNAGTIECLLGGDQSFYFMEMNTRLQVEHPVSEEVTGIDLVRSQLRLAMGEPLPLQGIAPTHGHAIEFRINAEDPARGFMPSPGPAAPLPPAARPRRARRHARLRGLHACRRTTTRSSPS